MSEIKELRIRTFNFGRTSYDEQYMIIVTQEGEKFKLWFNTKQQMLFLADEGLDGYRAWDYGDGS